MKIVAISARCHRDASLASLFIYKKTVSIYPHELFWSPVANRVREIISPSRAAPKGVALELSKIVDISICKESQNTSNWAPSAI